MDPLDLLRPMMRGWTVPLAIFASTYLLFSQFLLPSQMGECGLFPYDHFVVFSKRVVTPDGVISAGVEVENGRIVSVIKRSEAPKSREGLHVLDYGNAVVMPGLIDVHVHLDEPGREEWEGFLTGTQAAAAGGITTLVDMPLNSYPATTTVEALDLKLRAAKGKLAVDVGFWGGLVPENAENLTALAELLDAGVLGLKSFMCPSGINDFPMTTAAHIKASLNVLARYGRPILVHAEVPLEDEGGPSEERPNRDSRSYQTYLDSRPPSWEQAAVQQLVDVAEATGIGGSAEGAQIHVVHLSDADGTLDLIKEAKAKGYAITVETCPHYLALAAENVTDGDTRFKCAPPLRTSSNRLKLWQALKDGSIDHLSSDHSPSTPELKLLQEGDFMKAWGGISSLQLVLPITWTFGQPHGITLQEVSAWWSSVPAQLAKLSRKGSIEFGKDADLVVWDPEASFIVGNDFQLFHKHKVTPYSGLPLSGRVISTFVRGQQVFSEGHHCSRPCGAPILAV